MIRNKPNESEAKVVLVSSPIGNLQDFSLRAINTLKDADIIACEDTRVTSLLLDKHNIEHKRLVSLYSQVEIEKSKLLLEEVKQKGLTLCYLSDAGTPGISDPGSILVQQAILNDIAVTFIPGPSASISALIMSGFDTSKFTFVGFTSKKKSQMTTQLAQYKQNKECLIFYVTANNIIDLISASIDAFGERQLTICKELTKLHEEYIRGTNTELINEDLSFIKGELVVVFQGNNSDFDTKDEERINKIICQCKQENLSNKSIVKILTTIYPDNKNLMYDLVQKYKK